jgi:hypothetical protein
VGPIACPRCGAIVEYHRTNCERGHFVGFPNVRWAIEMRADLGRNYAAALSDGARRGVTPQLQQLETLLQGTVATININAKLLLNMALGQNYMSYYRSLDLGSRKIAEQRYHAHRGAVDEKVHTGYRSEIVNAALSPDGRGLTNYGPITLELHNGSIEDRASVMRENSWDFYERYKLERRDAQEEPGWRSTWADRAALGVAHLAPKITPATAYADIPDQILFSGATRTDDRYMETHIFGEISWQSLNKVILEKPLTTPEDQVDWTAGSQKLATRGITIVDRS